MARNVNLNSVYSFACCYFFWRILASQKVVTAREEHEAQLPLNVNFRFPPLFFCFAFLFPWVTISWGNPAQLSSEGSRAHDICVPKQNCVEVNWQSRLAKTIGPGSWTTAKTIHCRWAKLNCQCGIKCQIIGDQHKWGAESAPLSV